jgi:hypothetical protein
MLCSKISPAQLKEAPPDYQTTTEGNIATTTRLPEDGLQPVWQGRPLAVERPALFHRDLFPLAQGTRCSCVQCLYLIWVFESNLHNVCVMWCVCDMCVMCVNTWVELNLYSIVTGLKKITRLPQQPQQANLSGEEPPSSCGPAQLQPPPLPSWSKHLGLPCCSRWHLGLGQLPPLSPLFLREKTEAVGYNLLVSPVCTTYYLWFWRLMKCVQVLVVPYFRSVTFKALPGPEALNHYWQDENARAWKMTKTPCGTRSPRIELTSHHWENVSWIEG